MCFFSEQVYPFLVPILRMGDGGFGRIGTVVDVGSSEDRKRGVVVACSSSRRIHGNETKSNVEWCDVVLLGPHAGTRFEYRVALEWSDVRVNATATRAFALLLAPRRGRQAPALAAAAEACDAELCAELLGMGALVDESAYWHEIFAPTMHWNAETALVVAARKASSQTHVEIYERLLSAGADVDLPGCLMGESGVVASARTLLFDETLQHRHPSVTEKMREATVAAQAGWTRRSHRLFGPNARRAILAATAAVTKIPIALWEIHVLSYLSRSHWLERVRSFSNFSVGGAVSMPKSMVAFLTRAYFFCDTQTEWYQMQIHLTQLVLAVRNGKFGKSSKSFSEINWYSESLPWVPRDKPNAKLRLEWRHGDWFGPWPPPTPPEVGRAREYLFAANDRDTDLVWCGFYIRGKDWLETDKLLRQSLAIPGLA